MTVLSDKLQEFTIKTANQNQIELHAKASYVIWPRAQSYEVSSGVAYMLSLSLYIMSDFSSRSTGRCIRRNEGKHHGVKMHFKLGKSTLA